LKQSSETFKTDRVCTFTSIFNFLILFHTDLYLTYTRISGIFVKTNYYHYDNRYHTSDYDLNV